MTRRAVITGVGPVCAVGIGKEKFWDSVSKGKSNYTTIEPDRIDTSDREKYPTTIVALVEKQRIEQYIPQKMRRQLLVQGGSYAGLGLKFALTAAELSLTDADLDLKLEDRTRVGVLIGATTGDVILAQRRDENGEMPLSLPLMGYRHISAPCGFVAERYDIQGSSSPRVGACATGSLNVASAVEQIALGNLDVVLAGATSATIAAPLPFNEFSIQGGPMDLSNKPMCPFDANRRGFTIGEGAAVLVVEELEHAKMRNATIYAEVVGTGEATYSRNFAHVDARGYNAAVLNAFRSGGLTPSNLLEKTTYFSAHGSGTIMNDHQEMESVREIFCEAASEILIGGLKGTIGHAQAAASALELVACTLALKSGIVPPSTNIEQIDPAFKGLQIITTPTNAPLEYVIKTASGFGGVYSAIILKKYYE